MNSKSVRYKDTWAAPGSQLHAALEAKDDVLAKRIYDQCEDDARKLLQPRSGPSDRLHNSY